jgi:hypothetical protein
MDNNSNFLRLPKDIIKLIISYCPCPQWFTLCTELTSLALQVISPWNIEQIIDLALWNGQFQTTKYLLLPHFFKV